jgi:hypothetical protein
MKDIKIFCKAKVNKSSILHDEILSELMSYTPLVIQQDIEEFNWGDNNESIDTDRRQIIIRFSYPPQEDYNISFCSECSIDVEKLVERLHIKGECLDAYGSIYTDRGVLLNNYDASFTEDRCNEDGFCNVIGFATISKDKIVRFTQIVYSFKFKKLIIRDDVFYKLPQKVNIKTDFGGKRATYRHGSQLSLRTSLDVYKKVSDDYKQSDKYKNDLSYPRLILM